MYETIGKINDAVNGVVWGVPMLALLMGVGALLTIALKGLQLRRFGYVMRNTVGRMFRKTEAKAGEVTPFQAMTTALAATVGTGNIAGTTACITIGGPGALFWLWVSALLGMATKYSEVTLAVRYRERSERGDWVGGPMYYIQNGLGRNWRWLSVLFCLFGGLASFGIGNAVQIGNITGAVENALQVCFPAAAGHSRTLTVGLAAVLAMVIGAVLIGGVKRVGSVTGTLVPFMSAVYIAACLAVICANAGRLPDVLASVLAGAFTPRGVTGGAVGSMAMCLTWGVKRGVFSNEAGLGSAPIAHAATSETDPVRQGLYGIFEVFMDTIVICTLSALTILLALTPEQLHYGVQGNVSLNAAALGTVFGDRLGALIVAVGLILFALSTVFSWGLYGARCWEFLLGSGAILPYQMIFTAVSFISAMIDLSLIWNISDTLNALMALPNLIAVLLLSPVVVRLTREHFAAGARRR